MVVTTLWASVSSTALLAAAPETIEFNRDIRPILSDKCFACHGFDAKTREAELRLDTPEGAYALIDGVQAIKPGDLNASEVWRRIITTDKEEVMPPPESHKHLTDAEKDLLKRWIEGGAEYQQHWAFVPPKKRPLPVVLKTDWPRNPIDHFILARLDREGLPHAPEASSATLVRRVTLDLTGLPPTPETLHIFLTNEKTDSTKAYDRLVDSLLASRDYAERRAQDWLDLARYADTRGFADDKDRQIWPYRDWVVDSIDGNMPFDQFTIEQLAGDMLPQPTTDQRIATGFHRNAPQAKGMTYPPEEYRIKGVKDRVNTTAKVWFGLTMECAECHDHKFDPISQKDYFSLYAFFNNIEHSGKGFAQGGPKMTYKPADPTSAALSQLNPKGSKPKRSEISVPVMKELDKPRPTHLHIRGNFLTLGDEVTAAVPTILSQEVEKQPGNRLELARWLVDGNNPLVARVVVNRIWQSYFGHGLVRTADDFGTQGSQPTHLDLLDWLAHELVNSGWDMKHINRLIVTSATYRQSARITTTSAEKDPNQRLLSQMPRVRLPAEQIRDQALAISGLLKPYSGGPAVFPIQPKDYWKERDLPGRWVNNKNDGQHRKSLYIYWRRMALHPTMELLDAPARAMCTVKRNSANLPTQALVTLNDPIFVETARQLANRLITEVPKDPSARLDRAFQLCLSRLPDEQERERLLRFIDIQLKRYQETPSPEKTAWQSVASILLNLDETLNRP